MMAALAAWFLAIIAVEALTELWLTSSIMEPFRDAVGQMDGRISELSHCGQCVSVWASILLLGAFLPGTIIGFFLVDWAIKVLALHRLSNLFHELAYRWINRMPLIMTHTLKETLNAGIHGPHDQLQ